ncbi:MAG TPA: 50S ribosomal protein L31 [Roseiflexaceae bacterium]|nr:50S ribosomal protein L31 [Roseiflexaceae bacterium]HMP39759.1 50S ribosomal protein L31 [Roseiflexaceae bacterium]
MKQGIHPKTFNTQITCATCGTVWPVTSTREGIRVDVCSNCHPFYTGEQRIVDTAGQVDRFMRRLRTSQEQQAEAARRRDERNKPAPKKPSLLQEIYGDEE